MRPSRMNSSFSAVRIVIESGTVMDKKNNLVVAAYLLNRRKRDGVRRFNVHPIVAKRLFKAEFVALFSDLQEDEMKFFMYFKMSIRTFDELHAKLKSSMMRCDIYKKPISSRERLAVTIRYVIVDNLRYMLADYDSRHPIYFGCRFKNFTPQGYMSGGAGYVLSREALHRFVAQAMPDPTLCRFFAIGPEDVEMGKCLYNVGVRAMDSRDHQKRGRFLPFRPQDHLFNRMNKSFWYWEYVLYPTSADSNCCSDHAVSFHAIDPWMMYVFEYFLYHLRPYDLRLTSMAFTTPAGLFLNY